MDAFEAAAGQVKAETEGEQRIAASYQVGLLFSSRFFVASLNVPRYSVTAAVPVGIRASF